MTHWDNQAKQWTLIGPPLKPSLSDLENNATWINQHIQKTQQLKVLVLGVTPELIHLPWPADTSLFAIDYCTEMINSVLPRQTDTLMPNAIITNWLALPFVAHSMDIVIGDGCFTLLRENQYALMSKEVRRVLKPTGLFIIRSFSRPEESESLDLIHVDLLAGKIRNFHAFKLRLAMALHGDLTEGICLKKIWNYWNDNFKQNVEKNLQQWSWNHPTVHSIDTYKNTEDTYTFPTISEIRSRLTRDFIEDDIFIPDYYLGQCCPSFKFKPQA